MFWISFFDFFFVEIGEQRWETIRNTMMMNNEAETKIKVAMHRTYMTERKTKYLRISKIDWLMNEFKISILWSVKSSYCLSPKCSLVIALIFIFALIFQH